MTFTNFPSLSNIDSRLLSLSAMTMRPCGSMATPCGTCSSPGAEPFLPPMMRTNLPSLVDRKSTRLNSSHLVTSYAVFCLKKKNQTINATSRTGRCEARETTDDKRDRIRRSGGRSHDDSGERQRRRRRHHLTRRHQLCM